ncbi:TatD family hydrolase, partial [Pedobacter sp.]|uniref:TatD family hydrolase n=1 Tax=Pedobacter sp. TaxID=1411316 RepID=UPI003D7F3396
MQRCFDAQVQRLFLPNVDVASIAMIDELVQRYPDHCFAMAGLHPCDVKEDYAELLTTIKQSITGRRIVAIGEIGIDLYWDKTTLD